MKQIVLASTNQGKVREVAMMVQDMGIEIVPLSETAFQGEIEETGTTFEENAIIKAMQVAKTLGIPALADDSGLEIDYLNKEPGIYSARYMGHDTPYAIKNQKILDKLRDVPEEKRTARFVCDMALALPERHGRRRQQWKGVSVMRSRVKTDLDMIRYFTCRSLEKALRKSLRSRKTGSAIAGKHCG